MEPRRHSLTVPNLGADGTHEIVFYDWGDVTSNRTVICVHGLMRNAMDFAPLAQALVAKGRRVFSINMAGRGESSWLADPMGYNYATYVADCNAVMDNFHLRGVEWVGTSMGGIIGMMIAANSRDRIRKLVLNDIGIHISREALGRIMTYVAALPKAFASRDAASQWLHTIYAPFGITKPEDWEQFVTASLTTRDGTVRYACDPAIIEPMRAATQNFTDVQDVNLASVWEQIDLPTLILHGADSDVLTEDTIRAMRRTNPHSESVSLPGIGHAPALISPDQIGLVTNWLTRPTSAMMAAGL